MSSPYEANTSQASWRHSFLSLFRNSSPERGSRTSIHVASVARFSPAGPGATLRDVSSPTVSPRLVNISDFADSSLSESDQLHDSENIFLVIEEYAREPTYHFTEEMVGAVGALVQAEARPARPARDPSDGSLSSGALLDHLGQDPTPPFHTPQSSIDRAPQNYLQYPPSLSSTPSPRQTLSPYSPMVQFSSQPVSLPPLQPSPRFRPPDSSSLLGAELLGALSDSAPRMPAPVYVASEPAREWAPLPDNAPLARSHTRDSRSDVLSMFSGARNHKDVEKNHLFDHNHAAGGGGRDLEKNAADVPVLWTRWAAVLVCALVALPVFFLVAFGMFDRGGYTERPRGVGLGRAYYTRAQRALSFALGLVWLATVFAMVGVGFGLTVRRHM